MALLKKGDGDPTKLDKEFLAKINHARERLQRIATKRDEAWQFYRGNHFAYVDPEGRLQILPTSTSIRGRGKPKHKARQARNFILDVVLREAARATAMVPSYQVLASTPDPEDISAARLAEKVALYGYEKWDLRRMTIDAVLHAVVGGEAFAWPYFDTTVGPMLPDGEDGVVGVGEIKVPVFGSNQAYWTPGLRFEAAPWHCVELAMTPEQVEYIPGYQLKPGMLTKDADTRAMSGRFTDKAKLVMVTHYLERPCKEYKEGRWIIVANNRQVVPTMPYPGPGDDPVLRKLSYAPDPDSDRDMGLVPHLLDPMRTINDSENKAIEWKNLALNPQFAVTPGLFKRQRRTDEPGKVYEIPDPNQNLKVIDVPPIPSELFTMSDRATDHLLRIAAQQDIPSNVESGKAIEALIEKNQARSALFIADLAKFHTTIMRDCLALVSTRYEEPRLIQIKGETGAWESIADFKGANLRDQVDVRVFADSIEPQTRQEKERKIMNYVQIQALDPKQAMVAIETGAMDSIIRSYANDEGRAGRIIQRIKDGTVFEMPMLPTGRLAQVPQIDPMTGQPAIDPMTGGPVMVNSDQAEMAPGWMPRYSDNVNLWRSIFEDWMKTEEYERLLPEVQEVAAVIYAGILSLEAQKAAEEQAAMNAQAAGLGMQNAANPQVKPMPSLPSSNGGSSTPS